MEKIKNKDRLEKLLWSIALPGFGQILNGKYLKGVLLIVLELLINVQANFNLAIIYSFHGEIKQAIEITDYQWLMFYPCLYMFAIWDAYKDSGGGKKPFSYIPIVIAAYFVTVGLIYSTTFKVFGVLFGPIWLPILFLGIGLCIGFVIRALLLKLLINKKEFE